ncbi:[NiFe]-hydrogenase assembly chaperone HybE [Methylovulum miyakonense]|uniref:[NiFe]-hydrogenase assembly chaperone HybE n=1 Tax=Methylovulum miyakonense TaxID=645578 RepID=UPI00037672E3|nr:[NiFe]-hydrogenase assembly chaperone HybE [Methylovulum miyakonense]
MLWRESGQIRLALETAFNDILDARMGGLPIANTALSVQAIGFNRFNEDWLGVLLTPWCMNLLLLPGSDSTWCGQASGTSIERSFPYGTFEFTLGSETLLGMYAQCSLFSPMFQFADQAAALAAAQAALQGLLATPEPRGISRRDLLRGTIGKH